MIRRFQIGERVEVAFLRTEERPPFAQDFRFEIAGAYFLGDLQGFVETLQGGLVIVFGNADLPESFLVSARLPLTRPDSFRYHSASWQCLRASSVSPR